MRTMLIVLAALSWGAAGPEGVTPYPMRVAASYSLEYAQKRVERITAERSRRLAALDAAIADLKRWLLDSEIAPAARERAAKRLARLTKKRARVARRLDRRLEKAEKALAERRWVVESFRR